MDRVSSLISLTRVRRAADRVAAAALLALALLGPSSLAAAQQADDDDRSNADGARAARASREGMFLLHGVSPAGERSSPGVALAYGGYDAASDAATMEAIGDVKVIGPLDLRLGIAYVPDVEDGGKENSAQPHFGARVRFLSQRRQGIDAAFLLAYRMDRFTEEEGLVHGTFALGRRWGHFGTIANVGYAQDVEGDDREAELSLALLYEAARDVQLGFESRMRWDLFSDDPKHEERESNLLDLVAGPAAHWSIGPIAVLAQAGVHTARIDRLRTGAIVLGGVGYAY